MTKWLIGNQLKDMIAAHEFIRGEEMKRTPLNRFIGFSNAVY